MNAAPVGHGIAFFFRDVTERRRRDAALQRTEKLAAVGRMASSISHEINNPLESVTNLLYLIQHGESTPEDMSTYAQLASSELARVSHIVTQTLKFHRQSTHAALCRGSEILESVVALYQEPHRHPANEDPPQVCRERQHALFCRRYAAGIRKLDRQCAGCDRRKRAHLVTDAPRA